MSTETLISLHFGNWIESILTLILLLLGFISSTVHSLPHLTVLSLSGCSKITDDGVELIAENLQKLRALDLSWCPRITDASLEYIACDLNQLEELQLDRWVCDGVNGHGRENQLASYFGTMVVQQTMSYGFWPLRIDLHGRSARTIE